MKKIYSAPEVELRKFDVEDIITTSTINTNTATASAERDEIAQKLNTNLENISGISAGAVKVEDVKGKSDWTNW